MKTATVEQAQENLPELIEAAQAGETVQITSNGEAVASLIAPGRNGAAMAGLGSGDWTSRLGDLEDRGVVTRSKGGTRPSFPRLPEPVESAGVLDALIEERRGGR